MSVRIQNPEFAELDCRTLPVETLEVESCRLFEMIFESFPYFLST